MEHSWIPSGLYDEHCVHKFPCVGSGWAGVHLNTTGQSRSTSPAGAWFMNCWLLVGRRWRNRRQRPLVLDMCTCHTKSQWVTVTLTDSWVYILYTCTDTVLCLGRNRYCVLSLYKSPSSLLLYESLIQPTHQHIATECGQQIRDIHPLLN